MIDRRAFVAGGIAAFTTARSAFGQQPGPVPRRVGWLGDTFRGAATPLVDTFQAGLRETGYVVDQNVILDVRAPESRAGATLPQLAAELMQARPDAILAVTNGAAQAAKRASGTVPIVFMLVDEPVEMGLVASLARPGGNITGVTTMYRDVAGKHFEFLLEVLPRMSKVALVALGPRGFFRPGAAVDTVKESAARRRITIRTVEVPSIEEFDAACGDMTRDGVEAALLWPSLLLFAHQSRVAEIALSRRLPTTTLVEAPVRAGLFMAYMPSYADMFYRAGVMIGRILHGARPAELPVEQPARFQLLVNMKTAKALRLKLPLSLLARADHVFE